MAAFYLGIDTGGTFTDGVLLDPAQQKVVKTAKVLTTHHDLKICIAQMLQKLVPEGEEANGQVSAEDIRLVSLSTTLATNAIAEGKSRPLALFLLGYDSELVYQYNFHQQFGTQHFYFIPGGMDMQGREQCALDEALLEQRVKEVCGQVEAFAVSSYGGPMNSSHEERAAEIIRSITGQPVVLGNHLSSRLDSIRRATTASLNASLLSTAYDFLQTVQAMLANRGIRCPLIMVRGDGSLVSADYAANRPVEIIHSGPATSAIGGLYLAGVDSALVVDIGGTTTDLALLENGRTVLEGGDATVGPYRTSVNTIRARSFGLGGDSYIRFDPRGAVTVGPERVIPLSYLAQVYPEAAKELKEWLQFAPAAFYSEKIECWLLRREPIQPFSDPRTNQALSLLKEGPRRMAWLLKQVKAVSAVQVDAGMLVRQDIISRAGLTPTDLLHVTGEYAPWDAELPRLVVQAAARMAGLSVDAWVDAARKRMTRMIVAEIVQFLTGQPVPENVNGVNATSLATWLFDENLSSASPHLGCKIQLKMPLVGIGAPARAFLAPVAEALNTEVIFPEHYQVANAVGTVVSSVLIRREAEVLPVVSGPVRVGYRVRVNGTQAQFDELEEALHFARTTLIELTRGEALAAGAKSPSVELTEQALIGDIYALSACAVDKPGQN